MSLSFVKKCSKVLGKKKSCYRSDRYRATSEWTTTAVPIFESYTLTEAAPALNAELRLQIIVQGLVQNAEGKAEWEYLGTLFP